MYLIFIFESIYARPPFPSPTTTTLAYVIRRSERGEQENREIERESIYNFEKHTKESPGNKQLPGPPIRIKGLPRYLD